MDLESSEGRSFWYHVWKYVHEEVDVKYVLECLNEIQDRVDVAGEDDFLQESVEFAVDECCFEFQARELR